MKSYTTLDFGIGCSLPKSETLEALNNSEYKVERSDINYYKD